MTAAPPSVPSGSRDRQQEDLLAFVLDLGLRLTRARSATLELVDNDSLHILLARGEAGREPGARRSLPGTPASICRARKSPVLTEDGRAMLAPLRRKDEVVGILTLANPAASRFTPADLAVVGRLGEIAGLLWIATSGTEQQRRVQRELTASSRLALIASGRLSEEEVWRDIALTAADLLDVTSIRVTTPDGMELLCRGATGRLAEELGHRRPKRGTVDDLAAEHVDGVLLPDLAASPPLAGIPDWAGSVLAVPIRRVETMLGTVTAIDEAPGRLSEADRATLLRFGLHVAATVTEARFEREDQQRLEENRLAAGLVSALGASEDLAAVRQAIVREIPAAFHALGARLSELVKGQWSVTARRGDDFVIQQPLLPGRELLCGHTLRPEEGVHSCRLPEEGTYLLAAELGHTPDHLGCIQLTRKQVPFTGWEGQSLVRLGDIAAVALLGRSTQARLAHSADRIASVAEIASTLNQAATAEDAVRRAAEILERTLAVEALCVALIDEARQEIWFPAVRVGGVQLDDVRRPMADGFIEEVWRRGDTILLTEATAGFPGGLQLLGSASRGTLAGVPLRARGTIRGVVAVQDSRPDRSLELEDVRVLEIVARQLDATLDNIKAFEDERLGRICAEWLRQIARSATDPKATPLDALSLAADAVLAATDATSVQVGLLEPGDRLRVVVGRGEFSAAVGAEPYSIEGTPEGRAWASGGSVFSTPNTARDERLAPGYRAGARPRALASVAVWSEGQTLAFLTVTREAGRTFTRSEIDRLAQIADHAGAAHHTATGAAALRRSEARYRDLISAASEGIITLTPSGTIVSFNEAAERLWGIPAARAVGAPWGAVLTFEAMAEVERQVALAQAGEACTFESRLVRSDGLHRMVAVSIAPVMVAGEPTALLAIVRDVTDQRVLQAQLLQVEKMSAIGQLVGGMAHEINNPLASILVNMELLLTEVKDPAQLETLQAVKSEVDRTTVIVRNLLTYVRGQGSERALTDLRETVRAALRLRRYQLENRQIRVILEEGPDPLMVWGNSVNLQQVLMNLLINAEHAIAKSSGRGSVTVRVVRAGERALMVVEDDGPGIPPEIISRIFDPFFTTKPEGEGTGLGLSVSAGIVADHGGRLFAENLPTGGARFVAELPLRRVSPAPPPREGKPRSVQRARRILLIDDEVDIRRSIAKFLTRSGWQVSLADSGEEGLRLAMEADFDAVLCDVRMPGMSGPQFHDHLLRERSSLVERLIFMTGDVLSPEAQEFLARAARPTLAKPFQLQELAQALAGVAPA